MATAQKSKVKSHLPKVTKPKANKSSPTKTGVPEAAPETAQVQKQIPFVAEKPLTDAEANEAQIWAFHSILGIGKGIFVQYTMPDGTTYRCIVGRDRAPAREIDGQMIALTHIVTVPITADFTIAANLRPGQMIDFQEGHLIKSLESFARPDTPDTQDVPPEL